MSPRAKRWGGRLLRALVVLLGVLVLGIVGAWLYLTSGAGSERVRKLALDAAGEALAGKLEAKTLSLKGGLIVLEDVKLYTPEGELVAELKRAEVDVALMKLVSRDVVVRRAELQGLRLYLSSDERGLNLTRAVAAKVPKPDDPNAPVTQLHVDVQKLSLKDGYVDWQKQYTLDGVSIDGAVEVHSGEKLKLDGQLALKGSLLGEPSPLPLQLDALAMGEQLGVKLSLADARLDGELSLADTSARIAELFVPPDVAERFAKGFPLKVPVKATGTASVKGLDLKVEAGKARLGAKAVLAGAAVPSFEVKADDVDLSELLGKGRRSDISLEARGGVADTRLASLAGSLDLKAKWTSLGTLTVDAKAAGGDFTLSTLDLDVQGARVKASGRGNLKNVDVRADVDADDLAKLMKVVGEVTGSAPPAVAGAGTLRLEVQGPTKGPRLAAKGDLQALHVADLALRGVTLDAELANVMRPLEARIDAEVKRIASGEQNFDDVRVHLDTHGRDLDLLLSTKGLADMSLTAKGTVDADANGLLLNGLVLHYPEADWTLEAPTYLAFGDGVEVEPLVLVSTDQRLALQAKVKGGRLDAKVDAKNVELTRLPHAFVPTKWGLGGKLDLTASATGRTSAPSAEASVTWREGSVRTLRQLQLKLDARYAKERASGSFDATSSLGALKGSFDVPVKGLTKVTNEELSADVTLQDLVLEGLGPLAQADLPAKGRATIRVTATGTAAKPRVTARVEATDAVWELEERGGERYIPVDKLVLEVKPDEAGALGATLAARAFGAEADVKVLTPLTLEGVRAKPPTAESLRATEVQVDATVQHLKLETLQGANLVMTDLKGEVGLTLSAKGTVNSPQGEVTVTVHQLDNNRVKPIDASLKVVAERERTRLQLASRRGSVRLVELEMFAEAPLDALIDPKQLQGVPLHGHGDLGPFTLEELMDPNPDETQPRGTVKAGVALSGSLSDPKVELKGQLEQVAMGKVALGKANFTYDYEDALSTAAMTLFTGAGQLRTKGQVQLDVSLPSVERGVDWKKAPVTVELTSNGLDLSFLSGMVEMLPRVEGRLDANAKVSGTLGVPRFSGDLKLAGGRVAVQGYGEYRDVELIAKGSDEQFTLEKLFAKSGGGWASFYGRGTLKNGTWNVHFGGESTNFPIITDDQLKASASVENVTIDGIITADLIDIRRLAIPRAVIELPEVKGKDLQDLERPETIVLVRNGVPVNAKQRKKLAELEGRDPLAEEKKPARTIRIAIDATNNLWIKSSDVNVEAGLSEGFRVEVGQGASLFGEVKVKRGRIDVIGRRFDVDKSSYVRFSGLPTRAYVNVTATHRNEREAVTVFATVVGQLPQFNIRLTSNPPMAESDIFALVATGRRTLKQGGSAAITNDQVASVLGSLAASQLKGALGKKLPLDVLSIETGSEGLRGTRVEGGKYLTDDVYLGLEARYGADPRKGENDVAAKVEYQFVPHWTVEAYGGNAAYGADLVWSREF